MHVLPQILYTKYQVSGQLIIQINLIYQSD